MGTIDFNVLYAEAKTASFDPMPDGPYQFAVEEREARIASSGRHMIVVKFRCVAGPHAKRAITNNFVLVEDNAVALAIFFRNMAALGVPEAAIMTLGQVNGLDPLVNLIPIGRVVTLTLSQREWPAGSGQFRNEVKNVTSGQANGVPAMVGAPGVPTGVPAMPPMAPPVPVPQIGRAHV